MGGVTQHITYHLGDSLPRSAVERMQQDLDLLPKEKQPVEKRKRLQILLDNGYGSCILGFDDCAAESGRRSMRAAVSAMKSSTPPTTRNHAPLGIRRHRH
jgi:hypothetical protein